MRFGSTAKVLAKCKRKYYRISECGVVQGRRSGCELTSIWMRVSEMLSSARQDSNRFGVI